MAANPFRTRLIIFSIILGLIALITLGQYANLMLFQGTPVSEVDPESRERGTILDRKGRILASQNIVYNVVAWRPSIKDPAYTAEILADVLDLDQTGLQDKLSGGEGAAVLKRGLDKEEADALGKKLKESATPGIHLEDSTGRLYPQGRQASHVTGFVGHDGHGLDGIELAMEDELSGSGGLTPDGRIQGRQVMLTIDMDIQNYMETLANKAMAEHRPDGMVALVLDANNGEILSMVSRPDYNPGTYRESSPEDRRNRTVAYVYEPGSVFKVFTLSGIMSLGGINNNTVFHTSSGYRSSKFRDPITDLSDYGSLGVEGVIMRSSNVGAALASDTMDDKQFAALLRQFGFGEKTGVELQGEEKGIIKDIASWSARTKPTMAFGQEIGVSALQMVKAATVFANDGVMLRPHLVKKILSPGGQVLREVIREPVRQVIDPESARLMLSYMNAATEGGTARRSKVEGINISVKTGTSQMIDPETKSYSGEAYIASSLALFPTEAPRVIVYVAIFRPRGESFYGGMIAAPLIKDSAEFLIPHLGLERAGDQVQVQNAQMRITIPQLPGLRDQVPDFTGLPLRTLMPLLSQKRYPVTILGSGWVVSQNPLPGTPLEEGLALELTLSERPLEP